MKKNKNIKFTSLNIKLGMNKLIKLNKLMEKVKKINRGLFYLVAFVIIFWLLSMIILSMLLPNMNERGSFGDSFGFINALFSGIALAGVIYTLFLQQKELKLQKQELKLTREELKRTASAQEKSELALSKQAESLKITAKLNGLNALLSHNGTLQEIKSNGRWSMADPHLKTEAEELITKIKEAIQNK
jgi:uncharacterized membrane protein